MHEADKAPSDLTDAVLAARSGLRSDVKALIDSLGDAALFIPLSSHVAGATLGEAAPLSEDFALAPHMLVAPDGTLFAALFTRPELLDAFGAEIGWTTDGEALEYCTVPAALALEMALGVIDEREVAGLVVNPGSEAELMLRRSELASVARGAAVPLVGYVDRLLRGPDQTELVAEPGDPPPAELVGALDDLIRGSAQFSSYTLRRTFNAERDLEPHLTLTLQTRAQPDEFEHLAATVIETIEGKVPEPGYIDIFFEQSP
jgi:hypothetical protein